MKTRQDYMQNRCSHQEYYSQFVTPSMEEAVLKRFTPDSIRKAGEHLNGIPLAAWDNFGIGFHSILRAKFKVAGDSFSPAGVVCVLKQAARQAIEKSR